MSMVILSRVLPELDVVACSEFDMEETLCQQSMLVPYVGDGRTLSCLHEEQRSMSLPGSMEVDALPSETVGSGTWWSVSAAVPDVAASSGIRTTRGVSGWVLVRHRGQVECEWNHMSMQSMWKV